MDAKRRLAAVLGLLLSPVLNVAADYSPAEARAVATAEAALDRYALAFTLHYLCDRNPLAQGVFQGARAVQLDEQLAGIWSPMLMRLAGKVNRNPALHVMVCDPGGVLADQYPVLELTEELLSGLRQLDRQGSARLAFENGSWFRLSGHVVSFEQHVEQIIRRLDVVSGVARLAQN